MKTLTTTLLAAIAVALSACAADPPEAPPISPSSEGRPFLQEWTEQIISPPPPTYEPGSWEDLMLPSELQQPPVDPNAPQGRVAVVQGPQEDYEP